MSKRIVVQGVLSYPKLFAPVAYKTSKPKYSCNLLIQKGSDADKKVRKAILEAGQEAFTGKPDEVVRKWLQKYMASTKDTCYREDEEDTNIMRLSMSRASSDGRPALVDRQKRVIGESDGTLYPGCVVNADMSIWIQNSEYSGIRGSLSGIQFVRDGERLGGGPAADGALFEKFEEVYEIGSDGIDENDLI